MSERNVPLKALLGTEEIPTPDMYPSTVILPGILHDFLHKAIERSERGNHQSVNFNYNSTDSTTPNWVPSGILRGGEHGVGMLANFLTNRRRPHVHAHARPPVNESRTLTHEDYAFQQAISPLPSFREISRRTKDSRGFLADILASRSGSCMLVRNNPDEPIVPTVPDSRRAFDHARRVTLNNLEDTLSNMVSLGDVTAIQREIIPAIAMALSPAYTFYITPEAGSREMQKIEV